MQCIIGSIILREMKFTFYYVIYRLALTTESRLPLPPFFSTILIEHVTDRMQRDGLAGTFSLLKTFREFFHGETKRRLEGGRKLLKFDLHGFDCMPLLKFFSITVSSSLSFVALSKFP